MLKELFPRVHRRYSSLTVFGAALYGFAEFLEEQRYSRGPVLRHLRTVRRVDHMLQGRGIRSIGEITRAALRGCAPPPGRSQENADVAATVRLLEGFLDREGLLPPPGSPAPVQEKMAIYGSYLVQVRGLAAVSAKYHLSTAFQFIQHLDASDGLSRLAGLTPQNIEEFIRHTGSRVGRGSLQHTVAHVRSFLRFLASRGEVPVGLDVQIDTPRVYRGEQLPRALPWDTVCSLLQGIDRSTIIGRRDYAMLLLIATYGLRSSDVVGLRLEDIQWRLGQIRVSQRKTAAELLLPLTAAVGDSLLAYLRDGRPVVPFREIFVRHRAPAGVLKPTAVTEALQAQSRRSGLGIPFQGAHCLRHSLAVHLLRQGASLKVIGDVLGHRDAESTCVYLRLAVDDLRDVGLCLPESNSSAVRP